jgi:hypothetical protein
MRNRIGGIAAPEQRQKQRQALFDESLAGEITDGFTILISS